MWSKSISCNPVEAKILFGQRVWDIDSSFIEELKVSSRAKAEVKSVWNLLLNIQHQQFLTTILVEIDRPTTFWSCCKIRGWKVLNLAHRQTQPPCTSSLLGRRARGISWWVIVRRHLQVSAVEVEIEGIWDPVTIAVITQFEDWRVSPCKVKSTLHMKFWGSETTYKQDRWKRILKVR